MEKYNEVSKRHYPEVYESKKLGVPKTNVFKKSVHLPQRPDDSKNRIPFASKSKHNTTSINKKRSSFGNETKPNYKHNSEQYGIKRNTNLVVNAVSVEHNVAEQNLEQYCNFNGNLLNVHPTLCNLTCSVPEISPFNRVLNFQSNRHNELSFSKCAKHKQRAVFSDLRMPNIKSSSSSDAFTSCKYSSSSSCNIRNDCSKDNSWNVASVDPYFKVSLNETISENVTHDDLNLKCGLKYSNTSNDCKSISDLPIFVHSNFSKQWEVKYCLENKVRIGNKQRKWNSKNWNKVAMLPNRMAVNSRAFDKVDKMLFPALPSNSHSQIKLNSSHTSNSMPPSERSSPDNSDIESVHSFPDGNTNYTASSFITSVTSTIPQASYADVIRMSSAGIQNSSPADIDKTSDQNMLLNVAANSIADKHSPDENNQSANSEWVISRLSKLNQNYQDLVHNSFAQSNQNEQNNGSPRPIVVSLEKPSFYNSSLPGNKNILGIASHTVISCDHQELENESSIPENSCGSDEILPEKVTLLSESMQTAFLSDLPEKGLNDHSIHTDSIYSSPSSINSLSDAFKQPDSSILNISYSKTNEPPVVIMNSSSPSYIPEISFGIEHDEMIKLCAEASDSAVGNDSPFSLQDTEECCALDEKERPTVDHQSVKAQVPRETSHSASSSHSSNAVEQYIKIKGKKIYWSNPSSHGNCNYQQVAEYFANVWKELEDGSKECVEGK